LGKKKNQDILINILLDRSGSMSQRATDVIGHYNQYIEEQKKLPGKATVSLVLFDDQYEEVYLGQDIQILGLLTEKTYFVRGNTAYLDAIGKLIHSVDALPNKPKKVIFVVNTDGYENASKEYGWRQIKELVEERRKSFDWQFLFIGAGLDDAAMAQTVASSGFSGYTNTVGAGGQSIGASFSNLNSSTRNYRSGATADVNLGNSTVDVEEDEELVKKKGKK